MIDVVCRTLFVLALVLPAGGNVAGAADLLGDAAALEQKIREIVRPLLNNPPDRDASDPQQNGEETKPDDAKRKSLAPNGRAWAIVVGLTSEQGRHVYGYGRMAADSKEAPDGKTLFEIGSVTKTFTALLLADLVERGKAKLDDPVRRYLPDSVAMPRHGENEITLAHLATHTSALPRIPRSVGLLSLVSKNPYVYYGVDDLYSTLSRTKLDRDPGEQYAYSNLAFGLLGHVLSRQAGMTYEELVVKKVCEPLGLRDTRVQLSDELQKRFAKPYTASATPSSTWEFDAIEGAGALRSTADDMLTYLEANMGLKQSQLLPAMRRCHAVRHPTPNKIQFIGLGWHVEKRSEDTQLVFHGGGTGGYNCLVGFMQKAGEPTFGIVVLTNAGPAATGVVGNDVAVQLIRALGSDSD